MTDTKSGPNYQDILDKYADSMKSTAEPAPLQPEAENTPMPEPEALLNTELTPESKLEIHPQDELTLSSELPNISELLPETPIESEVNLESQAEIMTQPEPENVPEPEIETNITPELSPEPLNLTAPPSPEAITTPEAPLELNSDTPNLDAPKENHFFKYLFFFSLFIFIIVLISVILSFINSQKNLNSSTATPTLPLSPTDTPKTFCEINGQQYQIGESFLATDGCNKCACNADLTVVCTEMACEATPSMKLSPTSKLTPTTKISPTKIPTIIDEQE